MKFSYIASIDNCTYGYQQYCTHERWVTGWAHTLFQAKSLMPFLGFSRTLLLFIWIYLQPSKMVVLKAIFWVSTRYQHVHMQKSQTIQELENTCKPDIHCALVAQWTCAKVMKEQWVKNECFHTFCKNFENFIFCIPEHLFSFTLKLLSVDISRFCSIKKSTTFKTKTNFKYFQGL